MAAWPWRGTLRSIGRHRYSGYATLIAVKHTSRDLVYIGRRGGFYSSTYIELFELKSGGYMVEKVD